jgi:peptide-methionine (S)-S-oxide reductase
MRMSGIGSILSLRHWRKSVALLILATALPGFICVAAEDSRAIPAPALDERAGQATTEVAVFAGGCFWGVQGVFQHVDGVSKAVAGYAGGDKATATYDVVGSGETRHAEAVEMTFDPRKISYGQLLQIYFSVVHDPTQVDRQGPDVGSQYRSAIFPRNGEQTRVAQDYIAQLEKAHVFSAPIATRIEPHAAFYAAEDYHQDFMARHPTYPYIVVNDLAKLENFKRLFPEAYRAEPALVAAGARPHGAGH